MKIGEVGLEFVSREDREKALLTFTRSSTIKISNSGVRYREGSTPFGTYERDTCEVLFNCENCNGVFSSETCKVRKYQGLQYNWSKSLDDIEKTLCDGCFVTAKEEAEIFKAKKVLEGEGHLPLPNELAS